MSIRDTLASLLQSHNVMSVPESVHPYDLIKSQIDLLPVNDDGILLKQKFDFIESHLRQLEHEKEMFKSLITHLNSKALINNEFAEKLGLFAGSFPTNKIIIKELNFHDIMKEIIKSNFNNAEAYRMQNMEKLHNSITLLGTYYFNYQRRGDNATLAFLGASLLELLKREISGLKPVDINSAKLIFTQVKNNGRELYAKHRIDLMELFNHIRHNMIQQPALSKLTKALLMATLDLPDSHFFTGITPGREFYRPYLSEIAAGGTENKDNNQVAKTVGTQTSDMQFAEDSQLAEIGKLDGEGKDSNEKAITYAEEHKSKTKGGSDSVCEKPSDQLMSFSAACLNNNKEFNMNDDYEWWKIIEKKSPQLVQNMARCHPIPKAPRPLKKQSQLESEGKSSNQNGNPPEQQDINDNDHDAKCAQWKE